MSRIQRKIGLKRMFATAATVLALALAVTGCSAGETSSANKRAVTSIEEMEDITFRVATLSGPDVYTSKPIIEYTEAVTEATEGKIEFEFFYGNSLLPIDELAIGLRDGLVDLAIVIPSYSPATFPLDTWVSELGFAADASPVTGTLQGNAALLDWAFNTDEYLADFEAQGIKPLLPRLSTDHRYTLQCTDVVTTLDDIQGKRVKVGGETWANEVSNLGGVPVDMTASDVYSGLQQGVIDCQLAGMLDAVSLGITDHADQFLNVGAAGWTSNSLMMSQAAWDKLPLIAQQAMWDALPIYLETHVEAVMNEHIATFSDENLGVTVHEPSADVLHAVEQHHEEILATHSESAPDSVAKPKEVSASLIELYETWDERVAAMGYPDNSPSWQSYVEDHGTEPIDVEVWLEAVTEDILAPRRPQ